MMFVVGLTGGISSGKTAVSNLFTEKGIVVVDADQCARTVVEPGTLALTTITQHFGADILDKQGLLNRPKLRRLIFSDPEQKAWLEALLHPLIGEQVLLELNQSSSDYTLLVSPLLIESEQKNLCDRILVVDTTTDLQIKRTCQRDNSDEEQVKAIMASQASREQRLAFANDTIENTSGLNHLKAEVNRLDNNYRILARKKASGDSANEA